MIKSIIIDDEESGREALSKMINLFCPEAKVVGLAANISEGHTLIQQLNPDLVFLDVEMPGGSGFDLLEIIEKPDFHVVFTTAHAVYAIKAIRYAAMDYLLKPINIDELRNTIQKILNQKEKREQLLEKVEILKHNRNDTQFEFTKIALSTLSGLQFFWTNDIQFCEGINETTCVFNLMEGVTIEAKGSLLEFDDILSQGGFVRINSRIIINLSHVKTCNLNENTITLLDGRNMKVSPGRLTDLKIALESR
ncbi:MAG: LytTR family DNA-binding domain-containing protein [Flavobacteriales bacterium]|nr:LytTR family DNA-binding domain-containing protein [Flavobacteriales bacterium]